RVITPCDRGRDPAPVAPEHAHAHIECVLVVEHAHLRGVGAWRVGVGTLLHESRGDGRSGPDGFVESSVNGRCTAGDAAGPDRALPGGGTTCGRRSGGL